jgi:transcriptional regulator with XRE-family HTH domain
MVNIKEFRKLKGWTQTKLAEYLKVSKSMISQVESGTVPYPDLWDHKLRDIMFSDVKFEEPIVKLVDNYYPHFNFRIDKETSFNATVSPVF